MVLELLSRAVASSTSASVRSPATPRASSRLTSCGGGRNADVGGDQRLLEVFLGLLVARVERRFGDLVGERTSPLAQRVA